MAVHFPFVSYRECLFMDRQACCQMKLYRADYGESAFDLQGFGEGPIVSMHGKDIRQFSFGIVEIAKNILQFPHKSSGIKKVRKSGFAAVYPWG